MKSLKHYIKLIEATNQQPAYWTANLLVYYEFPNNDMIPMRNERIEEKIDSILKKYGFSEIGSGGGFGARDVQYANDDPSLEKVLANALKARGEVEEFMNAIKDSNAKLGIEGLEISVSGYINDSNYEYDLDFDEAEEVVTQSRLATNRYKK